MPINMFSISQREAMQVVDGIVKMARKEGGPAVAVAVVDAAARVVAFTAMDGVAPASIKLSQSKAYSAVVGQKDTISWASFPKNEHTVDFDMRNWTDENFSGFTGGIILTLHGKVIGGIGVSGRKGKMGQADKIMQDNELANYGKSIFKRNYNHEMNGSKLPGTDINLSPITFGAFAIGGWFWGGADEGDAVKAIQTAIDNGITTIDTAPVYGMGHSETVVGNTIRGMRHQVQVLSKFGMRWDVQKGDFTFETKDNAGNPVKIYKFSGKQSVIEECERSLQRLQTDYIDLFQMHWPESTTPIEETMEALEILKQQGKIRAAGLCNSPVDLLEKAGKVLPISTNQVAYSMVNRQIEKDLVPFCLENGIGVLPHTALQKGLLTGKIKPGHPFNEDDHRPGTPYFKKNNHIEVMKMLENIRPIACDNNMSLAQLAINWTMRQPAVISVLVGARNAEQMLENVRATAFSLTEEEINTIDIALEKMMLQL